MNCKDSLSSLPVEQSQQLAEHIRHWAEALGLTVGFTKPHIPAHHWQAFEHWLAQGYHGQMTYMDTPLRANPGAILPGTLSIISARLAYYDANSCSAESILFQKDKAYISRYALGRDYHKVLRSKLKTLCQRIEKEVGAFQWRPFADSAPILEHALAEQAGLGFIGKNSLLIHPRQGSFFFLGEILCNLSLPTDAPNDHCGCGPCSNCLRDCPTQAIVAPFVVDARRCISYLTIEHEGSIDPALRPLMGNRIYGCDDCQLTCPWNRFTPDTDSSDFRVRHQLDNTDLLTLWQWSEQDFNQRLEGSPIRRIGYSRWRRNLAIALGNAPSSSQIQQALTQALATADALVAEHIHWALMRQQQQCSSPDPLLRRNFVDLSRLRSRLGASQLVKN